jgi:hypothetical protein
MSTEEREREREQNIEEKTPKDPHITESIKEKKKTHSKYIELHVTNTYRQTKKRNRKEHEQKRGTRRKKNIEWEGK